MKNDNIVQKVILTKSIITKSRTYLTLPETIRIEFIDLEENIHAETILSSRIMNYVICLNTSLTIEEILIPLVHELVHVEQVYTKKLTVSTTGVYVWNNKTYAIDPKTILYFEYKQLPWEEDACNRQVMIVQEILNGNYQPI